MTTPGNELLFLALGGSGEIGMNVNLYGCQGKWIMVDLGMTFADPAYPGIDLVLPDLSFIEQRRKDLLGIILTHGHEDHIGAIPYLAADLGVPIYATPFTAGLVRSKLDEEGLSGEVKLKVVEQGGRVRLGPFDMRFMPMAHSIPEGNAVLIDTPYGRVFHSGDWKLDDAPLMGAPSTPDELAKIGEEGVLALVCDSTNVFNPEPSGSESAVRDGLMEVVATATGRVMVTTFASNAVRLQTLGEVALANGRQLCVAGRSLDRILRVGRSVGYFGEMPPTVSFDEAMRLPPRELLIVATGGQGEERATLARVANGTHQIKLGEGDSVVFSSRQIPGNELAIGRIQNLLAAKGVTMISDRQAFVHVSGHPGRPELEAMYGWLRPKIVVPVHGERRHLAEQVRVAMAAGVPRAIVQENGTPIRLAPDGPKAIGSERVGRLVLDGDVILPADGSTMGERRRLAMFGHISVAVAIDRQGRLVGKPEVRTQGVPVEEDRDDFLAEAREQVTAAVGKERDDAKLREKIRLAVRRVATEWTGKKPVVDVLLVQA